MYSSAIADTFSENVNNLCSLRMLNRLQKHMIWTTVTQFVDVLILDLSEASYKLQFKEIFEFCNVSVSLHEPVVHRFLFLLSLHTWRKNNYIQFFHDNRFS